jgi:exopolyphosphatase/guanosine-5'-triphosphate,3'-diphosphate pyrophosphatase
MILAGALLFEECMDMLGAKRAVTTEFSLRDGILEEELRVSNQGGGSHLALHLSDLVEKAKLFGVDEAHSLRVVRLAEVLFDALIPLHKLKPSWKIYLAAAVILRDTGEAISLSGHEAHSCYIVENADFPGAEEWEAELVAKLCRYHEGTKLEHDDLTGLAKNLRDPFQKLLALLRIVDALDSGPESNVRIKRVQVSKGEVKVQYTGRGLTGLEALTVEKRAQYFKKVLRRSISASPTRS